MVKGERESEREKSKLEEFRRKIDRKTWNPLSENPPFPKKCILTGCAVPAWKKMHLLPRIFRLPHATDRVFAQIFHEERAQANNTVDFGTPEKEQCHTMMEMNGLRKLFFRVNSIWIKAVQQFVFCLLPKIYFRSSRVVFIRISLPYSQTENKRFWEAYKIKGKYLEIYFLVIRS